MSHSLWILPLTFVFLASSLIWFLIGCKGHWALKLLMMLVTAALAVAEWQTIDQMFGYPKVTTVSEFGNKTATLYRMVVQEPKVIFLWMKLDGDPEIRAYQIPYSRSMAKQQDVGGSGDPARIQFTEKKSAPKGGGSGSGEESGNMSNSGTFEFYVLPPPLVPEKIKQQ